MNELQQLEQDLHYVRSAVERADVNPAPRLICFLWAVLGGVGFALVDIRGVWVPTYWTVAGPGGLLLSAYLGWRHARHLGQPCALTGRRQLWHWGSMLAAVYLVLLLPVLTPTSWAIVGPTILLILALGYFQAGVHFYPAFRWIGLLLTLGYLLVLMRPAYAWLTLGLLFAVALVATGIYSSRHEATA